MRHLMFICLLLSTTISNAQECLIGGIGKEYKKSCEKRGIVCGKPNGVMYAAKFLTSTVCATVNEDDIIYAVTDEGFKLIGYDSFVAEYKGKLYVVRDNVDKRIVTFEVL